jgi:hypothetical protein
MKKRIGSPTSSAHHLFVAVSATLCRPCLRHQNKTKSQKKKKVPPKPRFAGVTSLAQPDDPFWLSDFQCFVGSQCVEAFSASKVGVSAMAQNLTQFAESLGNNSAAGMFLDHQIIEGQIGIRCKFCANAILRDQFKTPSVAAAQASIFQKNDDDDHVNGTAPISPIRKICSNSKKRRH